MKHSQALLIILLFLWPAALRAQDNCQSGSSAFAHHMEQAGLLRGRGQPGAAVAEYGCAMTLQPENAMPYRGRGNAYLSMGAYADAASDFSRMIELDPHDPVGYNNRGYTYYLLGRFNEALRDFNHALELDPDYARAVNNRGLIHLQQAAYQAAIDDFLQAIALGHDPLYAPYENLSRAYMGLGDYNQALSSVLQTHPPLIRFLPALLIAGLVFYLGGTWLWARRKKPPPPPPDAQPDAASAAAPATPPAGPPAARQPHPLLLALLAVALAAALALRRRANP